MKNNNNFLIKTGFTLIELLVVISIIGILASLALVSFTGAQKQARDTQRKNDLKQYQTALESYANQNEVYVASGETDPSSLCDDLVGLEEVCPVDPKSSIQNYSYCSNTNATSYVLWAEMENSDDYWVVCSSGKSALSTLEPTCGGSFNCQI